MPPDVFKPPFLEQIKSAEPTLDSAFKVVNSIAVLTVLRDSLTKALAEAGFEKRESIAALNQFLYDGAMEKKGESGVGQIKIKAIHNLRNSLHSFLPKSDSDAGHVKQAKRIDGRERSGLKKTDGYDPFDYDSKD